MAKKSERRLQKRLKRQEKAKNDAFAHQPLQQVADVNDYMTFSFKNLVLKYDLKNKYCNDYIRSQLLLKLHKLSCCTWSQLFMKDKQSGGIEAIEKKSIKTPLPPCVTEDIEKLYVFRFNAQHSRVIGMRVENVFHILFVDVGLDCYDH